jgi:hypothetical protein
MRDREEPRHGLPHGEPATLSRGPRGPPAIQRRRVRLPEPPAPIGQQGDRCSIKPWEAGRLYPCPDQAAPGQSSEQTWEKVVKRGQ